MFDVVRNCQSVFDTNLVGLKEEIFISLFMQHIIGEEMVIKWQNLWGTFLVAHCCNFSYLLWYSTFKCTSSFWLNDFCHCNKTFWNFILFSSCFYCNSEVDNWKWNLHFKIMMEQLYVQMPPILNNNLKLNTWKFQKIDVMMPKIGDFVNNNLVGFCYILCLIS